jgi:hypothetical protein
MGYQDAGFQFESDSTAAAYLDGRSMFKNNLVHAVASPYRVSSATLTNATDVKTKAESEGCITYTNAGDIQLTLPFSLSAPNWMPIVGSPALSGANFTGLTGFTTVTYRGAFGTDNWTTNWTSFTPQTNSY